MKRRGVIVLDCGATNVKACLVDEEGQVVATHSIINKVSPDVFFEGGLIWDAGEIFAKMIRCVRAVMGISGDNEISALTVTSFGVDGAPVKRDGSLCYPVISWQCPRTQSALQNCGRYFSNDELYVVTGLQSYHFNTLFKMIWFKENRPDRNAELYDSLYNNYRKTVLSRR
jgi:L-fuculokinase